jgi:biopolymer transport protein ExbD
MMIIYLLQVTVCMAVFFGFYFIALRKETLFHSNRFYLLATLCLSFLLPLVRIYINALGSQSMIVQAPVYIGSYLQNFDNGIITPEDYPFNWLNWLAILYWTGVGVMVIRLLLSLRSIWVLKKEARMVKIDNQFCAHSSRVVSPFSFFNTIFLPDNHSFTKEELKDVICHEHAHVRGKHSWDIILLEFANIFLWPSPLIYFYRKAIKEIHEYIADAAVIQHTSWTSYSDFLIQQRNQVFQHTLSSPLIYSTLKKRMIMMSQSKSKGISNLKYFSIVPLILVLMTFVSCREQKSNGSQVSRDAVSPREKIDTISMNAQLQYFMNGHAITNDQLESAILNGANHNLERHVILRTDQSNTIQEIADVFTVADKVYARMIILTE